MPFPTYSPDDGNGVELKNPDGLFCHGAVIDVVGSDLLIDLYTSTVLVPCSEAFKCRRTHMLTYEWMCSEIVYPSEVVVLLQLSPKKPWTWYPGTLIAAHNGDFAVVRVNAADAESSLEVVRFDHVRLADKYLPEPVEIGVDFSKAVLDIPEAFKLDGRALMRLWNYRMRHEGVKAVGHLNRKLTIVGGSSSISELKINKSKWAHFLDKALENTEVEVQCSLKNSSTTYPVQQLQAVPQKSFIDLLPPEILQKIFTFLDVYEQTRNRSVCRRWKDFLPLCATINPKLMWINIDTSVNVGGQHGNDTLKFGVCLSKYYHDRLDTIVISVVKNGHQDVRFLLELLAALDKMRSVLLRPQLKRLVLSDVTLALRCKYSGDIYPRYLGGIAEILKTVCETVFLHKVSIRIAEFPRLVTNYESDTDQPSKVFDFVEINGSIDLRKPSCDKEFLSILESGLDHPTVQQMDAIGQMIRREREVDQDGIHFVYAVIESVQQSDPRPGAYHMDDITDPDLPNCLPKLNKLSLHALMKLTELIETDKDLQD